MTVGWFLHPKAILIHRIQKKTDRISHNKTIQTSGGSRSMGFGVIDAATFRLNHNFACDFKMFRFTVSF